MNDRVPAHDRELFPDDELRTAIYAQKFEALQKALRSFVLASITVSDSDLGQMQETVRRAQSFGHIVDPTQYRETLRTGSLERQGKLLDIVARTRRELRELFPGDAAFWNALEESHRAEEGGTQ